MTTTGIIKWINEAKGFGLVTPDSGGKDLFARFKPTPSQRQAQVRQAETEAEGVLRHHRRAGRRSGAEHQGHRLIHVIAGGRRHSVRN